MAVGDIFRTYYEEDGAVRRRVMKELGSGLRVITSDTEEHPDIAEFMRLHPDAQIKGYHPDTDREFPSPTSFNVSQLPEFLAGIESVDVILRMKEHDDRVTAQELYDERIQEILGMPMPSTPEPEDEDEEEVEPVVEEEEDELSD